MSEESAPTTGQDQATASQPTPKTLAQVRADARAASVQLATRPAPEPAPAEGGVSPEPTPEPAPAPAVSQPTPVQDATGRLHDPASGQFVEKTTPADGEVQDEPTERGGEVADSGGEAVVEAAAPPVREGFVRLPLPDKHPLRDRGTTYIDVPADREQDFRHLVNTPIRRSELEKAAADSKRARDLYERARSENAQLRARLEVLQSGGDPLTDPQVKRLYEDIKETYGEEQAELFKTGLDAKRDEQIRTREQQLLNDAQQRAAAERFMEDVQANIRGRYPVWDKSGELAHRTLVRHDDGTTEWGVEPSQKIVAVLERFAARVDAGTAQPTADEFFRMLDIEYVLDPRVKAQIAEYNEQKLKREREQAAREALAQVKAEEAERLKEAAGRRAGNPHRGLATVQTGTRSTAVPEPPTEDLTPSQLRRHLREQVRRLAGGK